MFYRLGLGVLTVLVSGCLLKPYEKPPAKQETPFTGSVSLMDLSTLSSKGELIGQAEIEAKFVKSSSRALQSSIRPYPLTLDRNQRGLQCQLVSARPYRDEKQFVSVGKLMMGTPTSTQAIEIPEVSTGVYQKELLPHFAPGIYFLKLLGKESSYSFMVEFSMPEEVRAVQVNNHGLDEGPAVVQKSADCLIELDPVTAPNDMNILETVLITSTGEETRALVCGALESQLEVINGKTQLSIPAAQMSGLFATIDAQLRIFRVNSVSGALATGPNLRVEGIRAWAWPSLVAE